MARIQIDLPESFLFSTEIPIYIQHINYGHHVDNAGLLSLVAEGRVRFLKSMGYTELDTEGCGLIVADAAVQYRSEAFHGETLVADFAVADFHLGVGSYSLTVAAHGADTHLAGNYDWWDQVLTLEVGPGPRAPFTGITRLPVVARLERQGA